MGQAATNAKHSNHSHVMERRRLIACNVNRLAAKGVSHSVQYNLMTRSCKVVPVVELTRAVRSDPLHLLDHDRRPPPCSTRQEENHRLSGWLQTHHPPARLQVCGTRAFKTLRSGHGRDEHCQSGERFCRGGVFCFPFNNYVRTSEPLLRSGTC